MSALGGPDTFEVVLRRLPTALYAAGKARNDELLREFAHVANSDPERHAVPARLLEVVQATREHYAGFSDGTTQEILDAHDRGESHVDAVYRVPAHLAPQVAELTAQVEALFDEADEYCRSGDLLALEPAEDVARLRRWFLQEFRRQILEGREPLPYDEFAT